MKTKLLGSLLVAAALFVTGATAQTPDPVPAVVPALETSINVSLKVSSTGTESSHGPAANATVQAKLKMDKHNTRDFLAYLNAQYNLVPNINGWKLVGVLLDPADASANYRFYLVKDGETPVLIPSANITLTVDAAAYAYREQSTDGVLASGGGKFTYAVTLTVGEFTLHGIASGAYNVRAVTVNGTTSTLVIPSVIVLRVSGVKDDGTNRSVVEGTIVLTAHKAVDLNDYPAPPAPPPEPEPTPTP